MPFQALDSLHLLRKLSQTYPLSRYTPQCIAQVQYALPAACSPEHRDNTEERDYTSTHEQRNTDAACVEDRPRSSNHTSNLVCSEGGGVDEQLSRLLRIRLGAFCGSLHRPRARWQGVIRSRDDRVWRNDLQCLQWRNAVSLYAKGSRCIGTGIYDSDRTLRHKTEKMDGFDYRDWKGHQQKHDKCYQ